MRKFGFRAECLHDVSTFVAAVAEQARIFDVNVKQDQIFPDCDAWIVVDLTLKELKKIACDIEDAHIVEESIALEGD
jgi:hypothetical protein